MCDHCGKTDVLYCLQCGEVEHPDGYCYDSVYSAAVCYDCYIAYRRTQPPEEPARGWRAKPRGDARSRQLAAGRLNMTIVNALSLNMLPATVAGGAIVFLRLTLEEAQRLVAASGQIVSAIGHADTARVIGQQLGIELSADRRTITLTGEPVLVAQYIGPRLPEGATQLPEGARVEYFVAALANDGRAEAARQLGLAVA